MLVFTDRSATTNPGLTEARAVIRQNGPTNLLIILAKAVTSSGTSYEGKLEAIKISKEFAKENISYEMENIYIFVDCKSAIHAITQQNNQNYHDLNISSIR